MENVKDILSASADTLLDNSVQIKIEVLNPRWWERKAMKLGWLPSKRSFLIKPATLGTMIRISKALLSIEVESLKSNKSALDANYQIFENHGKILAEVVAMAITNSKEVPDKRLVSFLQENLNGKELFSITQIIIKQLDVLNFMSTIISIRGMSLLSPGGTIASGVPSEG